MSWHLGNTETHCYYVSPGIHLRKRIWTCSFLSFHLQASYMQLHPSAPAIWSLWGKRGNIPEAKQERTSRICIILLLPMDLGLNFFLFQRQQLLKSFGDDVFSMLGTWESSEEQHSMVSHSLTLRCRHWNGTAGWRRSIFFLGPLPCPRGQFGKLELLHWAAWGWKAGQGNYNE